MGMNYEGILALWYDSWLVIAGLVVSIILTLMVVLRENWRGYGPFAVVMMALGIMLCLPLALTRLGINVQIGAPENIGYASLLGTIVAVVIGTSRLVPRTRVNSGEVFGSPSTVQHPEEPVGDPGLGAATLPGMVQDMTPQPSDEAIAWLHFTAGPAAGQSIPLPTTTVRVGRGLDNDIVLDDATVSRNHAAIAFQNNEYYIEDVGSLGGTIVEGAPATRTLLSSGATLKIGGAELVFMRNESTTATIGGAGSSGPTGSTGRSGATGVDPSETVVMRHAPSRILAWLAVTDGPSKGRTYQLREGDNTVGREGENDLVIEDNAISRRHAMVRVQDDRYVLIDMGSRGGTRIGNRVIEGKPVASGGVITLGNTWLNLVQVANQEELPPETVSGQTMIDQPSGSLAVLIAQSGPDSGRSFPLVAGDNAIGRDPGSQVLLTDEAVSRRHAMVRLEGDGFLVFDLGSRAGTRVNGEVIQGQEISVGDRFSIGRSEVVLMRPGS